MTKKRSTARKAPANRSGRRQASPIVISPPPMKEKFSAVLLRFAEPFLPDEDDYEEFNNRIKLSVTAWNLALYPPLLRPVALKIALEEYPILSHSKVKKELLTLLKRRETLFAEYDWPIVAFRVHETADEFRVEVMVEL